MAVTAAEPAAEPAEQPHPKTRDNVLPAAPGQNQGQKNARASRKTLPRSVNARRAYHAYGPPVKPHNPRAKRRAQITRSALKASKARGDNQDAQRAAVAVALRNAPRRRARPGSPFPPAYN